MAKKQRYEKEVQDFNEIMKNLNKNFTILRPGGNDTCLIVTNGMIPVSGVRRKINKFIQQSYPNIEQVGFVNPETPELMMAGGEFCGNATRSAAWLILEGKYGEILIKASGVEQKLKAGVTRTGKAFSQMPVYSDLSRIKQTGKYNYLVTMEGITHFVDLTPGTTNGLSRGEIRQKAKIIIQEKKLDRYPAAGVIYVNTTGNELQIEPIVYVREIDSLFYETACGSGTTALGLVLALQKGSSITNIPVIQPSGKSIEISVDFDRESFGYSQIQGEIAQLSRGLVNLEEDI